MGGSVASAYLAITFLIVRVNGTIAMSKRDTGVGDDTPSANRRTVLKTLGAAGTGLAGIANAPLGHAQQNVELDMWLGFITESQSQRRYIQQLVKEAESKFGITINVRGVPYNNFTEEFRAARAAGNLPHLVDVQTNPEVLAGDVAMVIDDLFDGSKTQKKISDGVLNPMKVWGKQATGKEQMVVWPFGIKPHIPTWRMDWVKQAGLSREDINYSAGSHSYRGDLANIYGKLKQTKHGQQKGSFPSTTAMKPSDLELLSMYIPQFGGSLTGVGNEAGTAAAIDSKAARDAIRMQFDFMEKGYFHQNAINHGDEEATTLQWAGKLAVNPLQDIADIWSAYRSDQSKAMNNLEYAWSLPHNGGTKATMAWYGAMGFVGPAFKSQTEKDAAAKFLDWWAANPQNALGNAQKLGMIPVNPEVIRQNDWFAKTKLHEHFWRGASLKAFEECKHGTAPLVPGGQAIIYDIPAKMYQRIAQGTSIKQATSQAATEINNVLKKHGRR